jgi:dipeptidyl aminopeptidase/acylaminoacyl peptidase
VLIAALCTAAAAAGGASAGPAAFPGKPAGAIAYALGYGAEPAFEKKPTRWLVTSDLSASRVRTLTPQPRRGSGKSDYYPAWSPDGKRVAFFRSGPAGGLYVTRADGGGIRRLVRRDPVRPAPTAPPVWSPDGRQLAFSLVGKTCPLRSAADAGLYVVHADGRGLRRITAAVPDGPDLPSSIRVAAWSPDGRKLMFTEESFGGDCRAISCCNAAVYEVPVAGGRPGLLAKPEAFALDAFGWSYDGTLFAYGRCSGDFCAVVVRGARSAVYYRGFQDGLGATADVRWAPHSHALATVATTPEFVQQGNGLLEAAVIDVDRGTILRRAIGKYWTGGDVDWAPGGDYFVALVRQTPVAVSADARSVVPLGTLRTRRGIGIDDASISLFVR